MLTQNMAELRKDTKPTRLVVNRLCPSTNASRTRGGGAAVNRSDDPRSGWRIGPECLGMAEEMRRSSQINKSKRARARDRARRVGAQGQCLATEGGHGPGATPGTTQPAKQRLGGRGENRRKQMEARTPPLQRQSGNKEATHVLCVLLLHLGKLSRQSPNLFRQEKSEWHNSV